MRRSCVSWFLVGIVGFLQNCHSIDFYKMELFTTLCWACRETELHCENEFRSRSNLEADDFEFPVGSKYGQGYYIAQGFGERNPRFGGRFHLGEDWNYEGGGDSDYAAPVYSIAKGIVTQVQSFAGGWGLVVRTCHKLTRELREEFGFSYVESLYAHLYSSQVSTGDAVGMGQWIASIGDGNNQYTSHLHFELRSEPGREIGGGYADEIQSYYIHPVKFLSYFQKRFAH